ncbi:MAG: putative acyl-CoA dehydrogenase [Frankiales bacterium]|nr:putative acyl-CoA dehydrogenase [Frankiales bacterium]
MQFRFDPEHEQLRRSVRGLLGDVASEEAVRHDMASEGGWEPATWRRLCAELDAAALIVPEEYGGGGFGLVELGVLFREAGRSLLCAPLLSTTLATLVLLESGDTAAAAAHLPGIASGATTATLAARADGDRRTPPAPSAARDGDGWTLSGRTTWVLDGSTAGLFVVSARTPAGPSLFCVDAGAPGVRVGAVETVDPTRRVAHLELSGAPAALLGEEGDALAVLGRALDATVVLLASEQVGVAEWCLESATGYAKTRVQFGRPIGSFQAVKHKLAAVLLEVEAATSAMMYGLWVADRRPAELAEVACIAGSTCGEAALLAAGENIQVHGGMGATWEHPAHLYLRRATVSRQLFGDPQAHLERLAGHIGLREQERA